MVLHGDRLGPSDDYRPQPRLVKGRAGGASYHHERWSEQPFAIATTSRGYELAVLRQLSGSDVRHLGAHMRVATIDYWANHDAAEVAKGRTARGRGTGNIPVGREHPMSPREPSRVVRPHGIQQEDIDVRSGVELASAVDIDYLGAGADVSPPALVATTGAEHVRQNCQQTGSGRHRL